jgi:hypothetical protein
LARVRSAFIVIWYAWNGKKIKLHPKSIRKSNQKYMNREHIYENKNFHQISLIIWDVEIRSHILKTETSFNHDKYEEAKLEFLINLYIVIILWVGHENIDLLF